MFATNSAFSSFSVDDSDAAKRFYGETLGLEITDGEMGTLALHVQGNAPITIYEKASNHAPASFTVLNFLVDDIDASVEALSAAGIALERYEGLNADDKGIMWGAEVGMGPNIAWFKDPAGNVLSVIEMSAS